jgi:ATP-dependent RNA helicase DeaD
MADARWLLPMLCRRGGIDKSDIGAIRVMDTTTEFEISARAAESFAVKIRRPDKEDNIRIEALDGPPQAEAPAEKRPHPPRRDAWQPDRASANDRPREERAPRHFDKPGGEGAPKFDKERRYDAKKPRGDKPAYAGKPKHGGTAGKPAFDKKASFGKKKKKFRG